MDNENLNKFRIELANLLDKYGVHELGLDYSDCSDVAGVHDECVAVFDWHGKGTSVGAGWAVSPKNLRDLAKA